jgi:acetyltransferase-like isoleucine patch superfamily enzyme
MIGLHSHLLVQMKKKRHSCCKMSHT